MGEEEKLTWQNYHGKIESNKAISIGQHVTFSSEGKTVAQDIISIN